MGATPNQSYLRYTFPSGMRVKFSHLEQEKNIYDWQGAQIPFIGFDELTHFSEKQFFYMLSRNRSTSGVPGYVRATTNPDSESWVRKFLDWWIGEDGFPIKSRDGVLRWFIRVNNELMWADSREELIKKYGPETLPKSVTFISARLEDNKILMEKDPGYRANLDNLPYVDRMRLLGGNWNVRPTAGNMFKREWFEIIDSLPEVVSTVRYWDRASSKKKNSAYTVGLLMHKTRSGQYIISDIVRFQERPLGVRTNIKNIAIQDGKKVTIWFEQDPGQAGVFEVDEYVRMLAGYHVKKNQVRQDKVERAKPLSSQCEQGNVKILRGRWNDTFFDEAEAFPDSNLKDQVDAASGAFNMLVKGHVEYSKEMAQAGKGKTLFSNKDID